MNVKVTYRIQGHRHEAVIDLKDEAGINSSVSNKWERCQ